MSGLNKVTLIGNITKDVEIQQLEGPISVARFSLTTRETVEDDKGQIQTTIEQHTVVLWRELAELAHKYLQRGSLIFLEGQLKTQWIDDDEGQTHCLTEIMGEHLVVLDKSSAVCRLADSSEARA